MARVVITLLFCVETFSRSLLLAIIPLKVLSFVGSMQGVALFYAAVAIMGLGNSILVPTLLRRLGSRAVVAAAGFLIVCGVVLLAADTLFGMALGLGIRVFAQSCLEISKMAFMMARIPRSQIGQFEPIRIFFQGAALSISPWLGFQLKEQINPSSPFYAAAASGGIILCLALIGLPPFRPDVKASLGRSPKETFRRFFSQPRLRVAWLLALIRSSFWVIFYIYAPVFSVACGWSPAEGAAVLSVGTSSLFLVPVWGRISRRFGVRPLLIGGYILGGLFLALTAIGALSFPPVAPVLLLSAAFAAALLDGSGNVPFLRATHPHERAAMAGIYMTYRDVSQFAPIAIFSLILSFSQLASAFIFSAASFLVAGRLARSIHPRLR
jgi:MFS transporter, ACDE family, multidrug resistance protein